MKRNRDNLIESYTDARGFVTQFSYDDRGNVTEVTDDVVRRASSSSSLYPGEIFTVGSLPRSAVVADVNHDGFLDVLTANDNSDNVSVLLGNGDGTFQPQRTFAVGDRPLTIAHGDVNGDRFVDIVTANLNSDNVSVLLGNGDGTFQSQQTFAVGDTPRSIVVGDLNGDSFLDIATCNDTSDTVSVLLSNGDGTFQDQQTFAGGSGAETIELGYVNADAFLDVIKGGSVMLGNGDGTLQAPRSSTGGGSSIALGDVNRDGFLDIVSGSDGGGGVSFALGKGDGTFRDSRTLFFAVVQSVELADVNGDGVLDIVAVNDASFSSGRSFIWVVLGNGDGTFQDLRSFELGSNISHSIALGDFDSDGFLDLVTSHSPDNFSLLLGNGDGTFHAQRVFAAGDDPYSIALGDFNGDGFVDIVTGNATPISGNVAVLLGDGNGTFQNQQTFEVGYYPVSVVVVDVDEDGLVDIVTANIGTDNVSVLLSKGDGTFQIQRTFAVGDSPSFVAIADVDADGFIDIVTSNISSNNVSILLGNGNGTFQAQSIAPVGNRPESVALGDVNGDNLIDIVTANGSNNNVSVLLGNGDGTFQIQQSFAVGPSPKYVVLGDVSGDGIVDIVTANYRTGVDLSNDVSVLQGNGDATFQAQRTFSVGAGAFTNLSVALADIDGDNFIDIVTAFSRKISVLLSNGDGTFRDPRNFATGGSSEFVALGDVDGDEFIDVVTTDISVLLHRGETSGSSAQPRTFQYDPLYSQLTSTTDELGRVTLYEIDTSNGNRLSSTQVIGELDSPENGEADDLITAVTYTTRGLVDLVTDPLGRITDFDYDALGRVERITFAVGTTDEAFRLFEYDAAGNQTTFVDENGNRTQFDYDEKNRLRMIIEPDPDGSGAENPLQSPVTEFTYDFRGNLETTTDARRNVTEYFYDEMDRLVLTRDELSNETTFSYDHDGNRIAVTDPNGNTTEYSYDQRDRLVATTDPDGGVTRFRYDFDNNLISLTDPVENRTGFAYDSRNRLIREIEIDPLGAETLYTYDAADNLTEMTDRNGRITRYEYDDVNRLETERWLDADDNEANTVLYTYDENSNIDTISDAFSFLDFDYDFRDRVKIVDNAGTPGAPHVVLNYSYDAVGNVRSVIDTIDGVAGAMTGYDYDDLDRLIKLTQTGPNLADKRVDFEYNALGQYEAINRFRDLAGTQLVVGTSYIYDALNRLDLMNHRNGSALQVAFYDFEYDSTSRITRITDTDGATNYGYDDRNQLISAIHDAAKLAKGFVNESYAYDANGNRQQSHLHGDDYVMPEMSANRLQSDGRYSYMYDDEGNTILRTVIAEGPDTGPLGSYRVFEWDQRNRLTAVIDKLVDNTPTQEVRFTYDALDRRISKSADTTPLDAIDAAITNFAYDREDVIVDFIDTDGSGPDQPTLSQRYLHGPAIDQVLAQDDATGIVHWHLTDHLGTVRDLADTNGVIANHILYDSFGNILAQSNDSLSARYLFTSREFDAETGLHFYRARSYDSQTGRFMSEDPISFAARDPNLYRYVRNNPLTFSDPSGLIPPVDSGPEPGRPIPDVPTIPKYVGNIACFVGCAFGLEGGVIPILYKFAPRAVPPVAAFCAATAGFDIPACAIGCGIPFPENSPSEFPTYYGYNLTPPYINPYTGEGTFFNPKTGQPVYP